jgi:hypothetical protein
MFLSGLRVFKKAAAHHIKIHLKIITSNGNP